MALTRDTMKLHHLAALGAALVAATTSMTSQAQEAAPASAAPAAPTGTNHSQFVGDFAIGFLGTTGLSIADETGGFEAVNAPVIGARYWLDDFMGIDAGLGFILASQSSKVEAGGTTTETEDPQPAGLVLHGGLPLALADSQYFVFEIVPELNVGLAGNTVDVGGTDVSLSGFHFDIGARAGAEVHFGFIDLPQLSLQAGIGVALAYDRVSATNEETNDSASASRLAFGTNVGGDPWDVFTGSIAALYYFDR